MCGGIEYEGHKVYFPQPNARIPVRLRGGIVTWIEWGRREQGPGYPFPAGGWARIDSIKAGKWRAWHPRSVLIQVERFMEKDEVRVSHWIDVAPGMVIQGLLAERGGENRVYVVTEETPPEYAWVHDRWPRLVPLPA